MTGEWKHMCESTPPPDYKPAVQANPLALEYQELLRSGAQPITVERQLGLLGKTAQTFAQTDGSKLRASFASAGSDEIARLEKHSATGQLLEMDDLSSADRGFTTKFVLGGTGSGSGRPFEYAAITTNLTDQSQNYYVLSRPNGQTLATWDKLDASGRITSHETGRMTSCTADEREFWWLNIGAGTKKYSPRP